MARRRSGKKIDFVHWSGVQELFAALAAGTSARTVFAAAHESETILRFRGNIAAYIDGLQATSRWAQVAVGMLLVPEGTGTTVLASPATNPDSSWLWYDIFTLGYEEIVADVVDVPGMSSYRASIDSKAMRIVRNQEVQLVAENVTIGSAVPVNISVTGRTLSGT